MTQETDVKKLLQSGIQKLKDKHMCDTDSDKLAELKKWLEDRFHELGFAHTKQIAVWLFVRISTRVLPFTWMAGLNNKQLIWLGPQWAAIDARVFARHPERGKGTTGLAIAAANDAYLCPAEMTTQDACIEAALAAACILDEDEKSIIQDTDSIVSGAIGIDPSAEDTFWAAIEKDQTWLTTNHYAIGDVSPALWHDGENPFAQMIADVKQYLAAQHNNRWKFFLDDYDHLLQGQSPDWSTLIKLASDDASDAWESSDIDKIDDYIGQ